jgi:hypothetical protein
MDSVKRQLRVQMSKLGGRMGKLEGKMGKMDSVMGTRIGVVESKVDKILDMLGQRPDGGTARAHPAGAE